VFFEVAFAGPLEAFVVSQGFHHSSVYQRGAKGHICFSYATEMKSFLLLFNFKEIFRRRRSECNRVVAWWLKGIVLFCLLGLIGSVPVSYRGSVLSDVSQPYQELSLSFIPVSAVISSVKYEVFSVSFIERNKFPTVQPTAAPNTPTRQPVILTSMAHFSLSKEVFDVSGLVNTDLPTAQPTVLQLSTGLVSAPLKSFGPTVLPTTLPTTSQVLSVKVSKILSGSPIYMPTPVPSRPLTSISASFSPSLSSTVGSVVISSSLLQSFSPTIAATRAPTISPTESPTFSPSSGPTDAPRATPTVEPTAGPTPEPTAEPTAQPTALATTQPTATPSDLPTSEPTEQPTDSPTLEPTLSPTAVPTREPTLSPTSEPTELPTDEPSAEPTAEPTAHVTAVPSSSPTESPSTLAPTADQTAQVSMYFVSMRLSGIASIPLPSVEPTTAPPLAIVTSVPTAEPTYAPTLEPTTAYPTVLPTVDPTIAPTPNPSATPTTEPTAAPTVEPSATPTPKPTTEPTVMPTAEPTVKPTVEPTPSPTVAPTVYPSPNPTAVPSTSAPTAPKPTALPTAAPSTNPTAGPTIDRTPYQDSAIYRQYLGAVRGASRETNALVFSSFNYQGSLITGSCDQYRTFMSATSLNLPYGAMYFSQLTLVTYAYDFLTLLSRANHSYTCSSRSAIASLVLAIEQRVSESISCNGHEWRVLNCVSVDGIVIPSMCVDCEPVCELGGCGKAAQVSVYDDDLYGDIIMSSSCSACKRTTQASYYLIDFHYGEDILYPQWLSPTVASSTKRSIRVTANVSTTGFLYCAAFVGNVSVASTQTVKQFGTVMIIRTAGPVTVDIDGLIPDTSYSVYCVTQDPTGVYVMPLALVADSLVSLRTQCCRSIFMPVLYTNIPAVSTASTSSSTQIDTLSLEALPTSGSLVVTLSLTSFNCSYSNTSSLTPSAAANPSSFEFYPSTTAILSKNFVILGNPGCYKLLASGAGIDSYNNFTKTIYIRSTTTPPRPPSLASAQFSNDGLRITATLDSPSNKGAKFNPFYLSSFNCSYVLNFRGSAASSCIWSSASVLVATVCSMVKVGDSVSLVSGSVTAACPTGLSCRSVNSNSPSVSVLAPALPIIPTVSLSGPSTIGSCTDLRMDPTATSGNGGRGWSKLVWSVSGTGVHIFSANLTSIADFLNYYYPTTSRVAVIPGSMLTAGSYAISLEVTNFFGQTSYGAVTVAVTLSTTLPTLSVAGPSTVTMYRWQSTALVASASFVTACSSDVVDNCPIYEWDVFEGAYVNSALKSTSKTGMNFKLASFTLQANTVYLVRVSLFSCSVASYQPLVYTSVILSVGRSAVTAIIGGGSVRSLTVGSNAVIDGSGSQDQDYPSRSLMFSWSCTCSGSSNFGAMCAGFASTNSSVVIWNTAGVTIPDGSTSASVSVTLNVFSFDGFSSSASATINILREPVPAVTINSPAAKYNGANVIVLTGYVSPLLGSATATWSCSTIALQNYSLTSVTKSVPIGTSAFQLAIAANSLSNGISYKFTLSAYYSYLGNTANDHALAEVTITMNSPPSNGVLSVSPLTGHALNTSFYFLTSNWVDDASDFPLAYSMSYMPLSSTALVLLKGRDITAYATGLVGQGIAAAQYVVVCYASATDLYGSTSNVSTSINVYPVLNNAVVLEAASKGIETALRSGNPVGVTQVIGAITSAINAVNCTVPRSCATLNRNPCTVVAHTCGSCLTGYVGALGSSNTACVSTRGRSTSVRSHAMAVMSTGCASDDDCDSFSECVNSACEPIRKTCNYNCNDNGFCTFADQSGKAVSSCALKDSFCTATCECYPGFYGAQCKNTLEEFEELQTVRSSLCSGLLSTRSIQDETVEIVSTQLNMMSNIMVDPLQLTLAGFETCSNVLFQTIEANPSYLSDADAASNSIAAYSSMLSIGPGFPVTELYNLSLGLANLANGIMSTLVEGQVASSYTTANMRLSSSVLALSDVGTSSFSPPMSELEQYTDQTSTATFSVSSSSVATITQNVGYTGVSSLGVSIIQLNQFPKLISSNAFSGGIMLTAYTKASSSSARKLLGTIDHSHAAVVTDDADKTVKVSVEVILRRLFGTLYDYDSYNGTIICPQAEKPFNLTVPCPNYHNNSNITHSVVCQGSVGLVHYYCPSVNTRTMCTRWSAYAEEFDVDPYCTLKVTSDNTTQCNCDVATGSSNSSDDSSSGGGSTDDFGSVSPSVSSAGVGAARFSIYSAESVIDTQAFEELVIVSFWEDQGKNAVIMYITVVSIILLLCILVYAIHIDMQELELHSKSEKEQELNQSRNFVEFLCSSKPTLFQKHDLARRFYRVIRDNHPWLWYFAPYRDESDYRTTKFMTVFGACVNYLFVDTMLMYMFYSIENHTCRAQRTQMDCTSISKFYALHELCLWEPKTNSCNVNSDVEFSYLSVILLSLFVSLLAVPLTAVVRALTIQTRNWYCSAYLSGPVEAVPLPDEAKYEIDMLSNIDDLPDPKGGVRSIISDHPRPGRLIKPGSGGVSLDDKPSMRQRPGIERNKSNDDLNNEALLDIDDLQTYTVTLMRAARLTKAMTTIDSTTIEDETSLIRAKLDEILEQKMFSGFVNSARVDFLSQRQSLMSKFGCYCKKYIDNLVLYVARLRTSSHYINEFEKHDSITAKVTFARQSADEIERRLLNCKDNASKEKLLLQQFTIHCFSTYRRFIADKFFNAPNEKLAAVKSKSNSTTYLCVLWLPLYLLIVIIVTLLIGVQLTPITTDMWLCGFLIPLFANIFLFTPLSLLMQWIGLASVVFGDVQTLHSVLSSKVRLIMLRRTGMMKHATSLIQHMNPACRVARRFPELTVSRLLLSLNSFDIPIEFAPIQTYFTPSFAVDSTGKTASSASLDNQRVSAISGALSSIFMYYWTMLPPLLQTLSIEMFATAMCVSMLLFLGEVAIWTNPSTPIIIVCIVVGLVSYREYIMARRSQAYVVDSGVNGVMMTNNYFDAQVDKQLKAGSSKKRLARQLQVYRRLRASKKRFNSERSIAVGDGGRPRSNSSEKAFNAPLRLNSTGDRSPSMMSGSKSPCYLNENVRSLVAKPLYDRQQNESIPFKPRQMNSKELFSKDESPNDESGNFSPDSYASPAMRRQLSNESRLSAVAGVFADSDEENKIDIQFGSDSKASPRDTGLSFGSPTLSDGKSLEFVLFSDSDENTSAEESDDNFSVMTALPSVINIKAEDALDNLAIAKSSSSQFFSTFFKTSEDYDETVANTAANSMSYRDQYMTESDAAAIVASPRRLLAAEKQAQLDRDREEKEREKEKRVSIKYSRPQNIPLPIPLAGFRADSPAETKSSAEAALAAVPVAESDLAPLSSASASGKAIVTGMSKSGAPSIKYQNPNAKPKPYTFGGMARSVTPRADLQNEDEIIPKVSPTQSTGSDEPDESKSPDLSPLPRIAANGNLKSCLAKRSKYGGGSTSASMDFSDQSTLQSMKGYSVSESVPELALRKSKGRITFDVPDGDEDKPSSVSKYRKVSIRTRRKPRPAMGIDCDEPSSDGANMSSHKQNRNSASSPMAMPASGCAETASTTLRPSSNQNGSGNNLCTGSAFASSRCRVGSGGSLGSVGSPLGLSTLGLVGAGGDSRTKDSGTDSDEAPMRDFVPSPVGASSGHVPRFPSADNAPADSLFASRIGSSGGTDPFNMALLMADDVFNETQTLQPPKKAHGSGKGFNGSRFHASGVSDSVGLLESDNSDSLKRSPRSRKSEPSEPSHHQHLSVPPPKKDNGSSSGGALSASSSVAEEDGETDPFQFLNAVSFSKFGSSDVLNGIGADDNSSGSVGAASVASGSSNPRTSKGSSSKGTKGSRTGGRNGSSSSSSHQHSIDAVDVVQSPLAAAAVASSTAPSISTSLGINEFGSGSNLSIHARPAGGRGILPPIQLPPVRRHSRSMGTNDGESTPTKPTK
jgi:hypothetical protein